MLPRGGWGIWLGAPGGLGYDVSLGRRLVITPFFGNRLLDRPQVPVEPRQDLFDELVSRWDVVRVVQF